MLQDNIKYLRKAKGFSQEEMAVRLHVVRQTISKWENGQSIPDAIMLIKIAELFDVSIDQLLDFPEETKHDPDLIEKLNHHIECLNKKENQIKQANQKRGLILFLSFLSMILVLTLQNGLISLFIIFTCIAANIFILYQNMELLTQVEDRDIQTLRRVTLVDSAFLIIAFILCVLIESGWILLNKNNEKIIVLAFICSFMVFAGLVSKKLPFNRHIGLRLPWTVLDEQTWLLAHHIINIISLPIVLLYIGASYCIPSFELVTSVTIVIWIGIPTVISYLFFYKKMHGK